jgi:hypothetical protein
LASSLAMAVGSVVASSQRIGPPHRGHVSTSARKTCRSSQPHLDLRLGSGAAVIPESASNSASWSPAAGGGAKRVGSMRFGTTKARWREWA